jgi:sec-independent protein translocase protein TatA
MAGLGTTEIIIIALVIVLLFGAKKLPDAARGIGRSLRIFKAETKGLREDDPDDETTRQAQPPAALPKGQQQAPQVAPPLEHDAKRDSV